MKTFTKLFLLSGLCIASVAQAQYCMLPGRTPYSSEQPGITSFKLNTINRTSANVESASTVVVTTGDSTTLLRGQSYTVTMVDSKDMTNFPTARNNIRVWLDYNKNFSFDDAGELVLTMDFHTPGTYTGTFTVPATAPLGYTMLRATAKMSSDAGHTLPTSCDNPADGLGYHGEMEDYIVKIASATAVNELVYNAPDVSVFPNPTLNHITVSFDGGKDQQVSIGLYDIAGKLVANLFNGKGQPFYDFDINAQAPSAGIYFIKVSSGAFSSYQKLVKVN